MDYINMFISIHAKKGYLNYICISDNNVSMKIIEIFYVIWHLVMLIHTSALINACTKHFKSIQNNGEKTKKNPKCTWGGNYKFLCIAFVVNCFDVNFFLGIESNWDTKFYISFSDERYIIPKIFIQNKCDFEEAL